MPAFAGMTERNGGKKDRAWPPGREPAATKPGWAPLSRENINREGGAVASSFAHIIPGGALSFVIPGAALSFVIPGGALSFVIPGGTHSFLIPGAAPSFVIPGAALYFVIPGAARRPGIHA
jgi:hypothetical protein